MRYVVHYAPPTPTPPPPAPILSPSPSPALNCPTASAHNHTMIVSVFLALLLPCAGMSLVIVFYVVLLWCVSSSNSTSNNFRVPVKRVAGEGLSTSELDKLPKITGKELVMGTECAVCLDEVESEQPARLVPGCNHGFHLQCADTWLSKHSACPVCRAKLDPQFFHALENPC